MSSQQRKVEVYCTDLRHSSQADLLERKLLGSFPHLRINFDLDDCDRILRIEYHHELNFARIEKISRKMGVQIRILDDE
jgi:hypothetical protein